MTKKKGTVGGRKSGGQKELLARRDFLVNAGKYSAAAAGVLAGSNALFGACASEGDDDDDGLSSWVNNPAGAAGSGGGTGTGAQDPLQRYQEEAKPLALQEDKSTAVAQGGETVYEIEVETTGDYLLSLSTSGRLDDTVHLSLVDADGNEIWSDDAYLGATWIWEDLQAGTYYLVIESGGGSGDLIVNVRANAEYDAGVDGAVWSDSGAWTDSAWSDNVWSDNAWSDSSGWKDAGTGTWVAYSDTWYNGEWDDGWLNYNYY